MKLPWIFLLALAAAPAIAATKPAAAASKVTPADRFAATRKRIDALLAQRTDPPPLVAADSANPFRLATDVAPSAPVAARVDLDRPLTDAELLPRLAAGLRIGGVLELGDAKPRVVINQRNFREGDTIAITYQGRPCTLAVKSLTPERLILGLNEAEVTIRLKKPR